MKELLTANRWEHFKTGCSCSGSPRYYKHVDHFGYVIIIRKSKFTIKKGNDIICSGKPEELNQKMIDYELIQKYTTEDKNLEA